jgi:Pentapeptide repeats (9 copies)
MTHEAAWEPDWPTCSTQSCIGISVENAEACLTHVDPHTRQTFLAALKPNAHLDLRGTPIDPELLGQLLTALKAKNGPITLQATFKGAQFSGDVRFDGAQFSGDARFKGAQFSGDARFKGAQFSGDARFNDAQFSGDATFEGAQFKGKARFEGTQFSKAAWFEEARFRGDTRFNDAQFSGRAWFSGAQFSKNVWFNNAQLSRDATFEGALFGEDAWFSGAQFCESAWFAGARFNEGGWFNGTQFKRAGSLGPVLAASRLILDQATFEQDIVIEALGAALSCVGTRFAGAATLRLRDAQVVLDSAVFAKPSTIAFASDTFKNHNTLTGSGGGVATFDESPVARVADSRLPRPRLLSLRGVDAATLTLSELDLSACLFQDAYHLDQIRIEGDQPFATTPAPWRLHLGRWWVPVWRRWSRRQTIAEEHHWRNEHPSPAVPGRWSRLAQPAWHGPACQAHGRVTEVPGQQVQPLTPDRLAVRYRALRKAQEDSKNEPGAADFYYGEMEMRRLDRRTPWAERLILGLYWLVSGYGLRGLRALGWLAAVVVGLAGLLQAIGFNGGDPGFRDTLIYAAQSTISIPSGNRALTEHVSWAGEVLRIVLRLAGPVLLGLALLSVRNRVKR